MNAPEPAVGLQGVCNGSKRLGGVTGRGWKPGQSGNPSGKRRGHASLTSAIKRLLTRADAEEIALRLISLAKAGDLRAVALLLDRLDATEIEDRIIALEQAARSFRQL